MSPSPAQQPPNPAPPPPPIVAGRIAPLTRLAGGGIHQRYGCDEYLPPPPALAEFILYLWCRRYDPDLGTILQPTLPDGCIDLIAVDQGAPWLMGPETVRMEHVVAGGTEIAGVRLRPGVGARLFGPALRELINGGAFLTDLAGGSRCSIGNRGFPELPTVYRRLLDALLPWFAAARPDDGVGFGVEWLNRHPAATVDRLSLRLGWSARDIRRRFVAALGVGPKATLRTLRFQRTLYLAQPAPGQPAPTLAQLAAAGGYADQAHMNREFRGLAGLTPGDLLGQPFDSTLDPIFSRFG